MTNEIRALVVARAPANIIRDKALEQGMRPIRRCGWEKVAQGLTTPEEVIRATLSEEG